MYWLRWLAKFRNGFQSGKTGILSSLVILAVSACMSGTPQSPAVRVDFAVVDAKNDGIHLARLEEVEKRSDLSEKQRIDIGYMKAKIHERAGRMGEAFRIYSSIDGMIPKNPYGFLAREKLRQFQNLKEDSIASFDLELPNVQSSETEALKNNIAYRNYVSGIRKKIDTLWSYPCLSKTGKIDCEVKDANATVAIQVTRDGNISRIAFLKRTGIPAYDFNALEAIILAAPFGAMPVSMDMRAINIRIAFNYVDNRPMR